MPDREISWKACLRYVPAAYRCEPVAGDNGPLTHSPVTVDARGRHSLAGIEALARHGGALALEQNDANLVKLRPAPMLPHRSAQDCKALPPIIAPRLAASFATQGGPVRGAEIKRCTVSSSDSEL
jgi:hypothetical protein